MTVGKFLFRFTFLCMVCVLPLAAFASTPMVTAGASHTVSLKTDGSLWGWGGNSSGQLGLGDQYSRLTPTRIGTENWLSVSAGSAHTIAIKNDGTLWTWGDNQSGQLGYESTPFTDRTVPQSIAGASTWVFVSAGPDFNMAIKSDGTLWTWGGTNSGGQSGLDSGPSALLIPLTQVGTDTDWAFVSPGTQHCLGLKRDGSLWAWGSNVDGRLGDGTIVSSLSPKKIGTDTNWVSVVAGSVFSFGIKSDGSLWAWGNGCQFGNCGTMSSPNKITNMSDSWIQLMPGGYNGHVLAIRSDGTLWFLGNNSNGQLGNGYSGGSYTFFIQTGIDTNWSGAAAGGNHTVAVKLNGSVFGWGKNTDGQLGFWTNNSADQLTPGLATPIRLAGGSNESYAVAPDGTLWGWGKNDWGELGIGTLGQIFSSPTQIGTDTTWLTVAAGSYSSLAVKSDGTLWQLGKIIDGDGFSNYEIPTQVGNDTDWVEAAVGVRHALALKRDGTLWAWGTNGAGELGNGTSTPSVTPQQIGFEGEHLGFTWSRIAAGGGFSAAIRSDGSLWGWGSNTYGQLADGGLASHIVPYSVNNASIWFSVSAGSGHLLAARESSHPNIAAAGYNYSGQVGVDPGVAPDIIERITSLNWITTTGSGTAEVRAGDYHSLALYQDGTLFSWGYGDSGQLGKGCTLGTEYCTEFAPYTFIGTKWASIAAGANHSLGQKADGTLWDWGYRPNGSSSTPVALDYTPLSLSNVTISSNNANPAWAKVGDTVTLSFTSSAVLAVPSVTIAGHTVVATKTDSSGLSWSASYIMTSGDVEGVIPFSIRYMDSLSGKSFSAQTFVTTGSNVTFDRTPPVVDAVTNNNPYITSPLNNGLNASLNHLIFDSSGYNCQWSLIGGLQNVITFSSTSYCSPFIGSTADGSYTLRLTATDQAGNSAYSDYSFIWDATPPTFSSVHIASNNSTNTGYATLGDTITLTFSTSEPIKLPMVYIMGMVPTTLSDDGSKKNWTATLVVDSNVVNLGEASAWLSISISDLARNNNFTNESDGSNVILDYASPSITPTSVIIRSTNADNTLAKVGDSVILNFSISEPVPVPSVTIAGHPVTPAKSTGTNDWQAVWVMTAEDTEGLVSFAINPVTDYAGHVSGVAPVVTTAFDNTYKVTFDRTSPTLAISAPSVSITNTASVSYTVTYSGFDTINLAPGDITLNRTGTTNGTVAVIGTGNPRMVTISGITGDGTLGISIAANTARDTAGNLAAASVASAAFTVDNTNPVVDAGSSQTKNSMFTQTSSATDAHLAGVLWSKQAGPGTITFGSPTSVVTTVSASAEGAYTLQLTATDTAGNSASSTMTLVWDTSAPILSISSPSVQVTNTSNVSYIVTYSDTNPIDVLLTASDITLNTTGSANGSVSVINSANHGTVTISGITGDGTLGISIAAGTASDLAGNSALASGPSSTFIVDNTQPVISIVSPADGYAQTTIAELVATVSDANESNMVEFQVNTVMNGHTYYLTAPNELKYNFIGDPPWLTGGYYAPDSTWVMSTPVGWFDNQTYTIQVRTTDRAGNVTIQRSEFIKVPPQVTGFTQITLSPLSATSILQGESVVVSGKLTRLPDNLLDLSKLPIILHITPPPGSAPMSPVTVFTNDPAGHFQSLPLTGFNDKGLYGISASFEATPTLASSSSETLTLSVGSQAGYAILVQGKIPPVDNVSEGIESHAKTTNRVYKALIKRGFSDTTINYFSYQTVAEATAAGVVVDAVPSRTAIQNAIENWAAAQMGAPAPLYIIMVDHGSVGNFIIDSDNITPADLNTWLNTLEGKLVGQAANEKRFVIDGSCFSGSFINALSKQGRVIITSAAKDEESYKGPYEPDTVRGGEYFIEALFAELKNGRSFKNSFDSAAEKTRIFTRMPDSSPNGTGLASDGSAQHPMLDDNGDGLGSNTLSVVAGDGLVSKDLFLGVGINYTNAALDTYEISAVSPTIILDPADPGQKLWLTTVGESNKIGSAWAELRSPGFPIPTGGGYSGQLSIDLPKLPMTHNSSTGKWETALTGFSTPGKYEVFYYATDSATGNISPMKRSVVYRKKPVIENNSPPSPPVLVSPSNGISQKTILFFDWKGTDSDPESIDLNGDRFTYSLFISRSSDFVNPYVTSDYVLEEIPVSQTDVGSEAKLLDLTPYFWMVRAIDQYGAYSDSAVFNFSTNNTNALPARIKGYVKETGGAPIVNATISNGAGVTAPSIAGGEFVMFVSPGTYTLSTSAPSFSSTGVSVTLASGAVLDTTLFMTDTGRPVVNGLTVPTSTSSDTVSVTAINALDNVAVVDYCISESDTTCSTWGRLPLNYTFTGLSPGVAAPKTLYAYARDAVGLISAATQYSKADITITLPSPSFSLQVSITGTGNVYQSPTVVGGINCTSGSATGCTANLPSGTVTLTATNAPDWRYGFDMWSGGPCDNSSNPVCTFTLNATSSMTAIFGLNLLSKVGAATFASLTEAYAAIAENGSGTIKVLTGSVFKENLALHKIKTVTIEGGFTNLTDPTGDGVSSAVIERPIGSIDPALKILGGRLNAKGLVLR